MHSISKNTIYTDMDRLDNFTNTIGMKFVTIAQGDFLMGSKDTGLPLDEQPQTKQQVDTILYAYYRSNTNAIGCK
ncbi:MAG: hypothetical protein Q9M36_03610 [Sulfurovum sp.]|nr:hypothetical protein [Sulfurovum sp.]